MPELPQLQHCQLSAGTWFGWRSWGTGPALILLHGWSMSSVVFMEVAARLAEDFQVLCPDLPGHGGSDPLPEYSFAALAAAVEQWAGQLQLGNAALLGWSLGGQVAMQLAANRRLAISRLLLVSTTPRFCNGDTWSYGLPELQVKALLRNLGRAYEKTLGDFFRLQFVGEELPKERYREIIRFAVRNGRLPATADSIAALRMLGAADLRSQLPRITQPTLITHGELDQIIPLGAGRYLAENLPQAELHQVEKIGHAPFFSRPEDCVSRWLGFLK